MDSSTVQIKSSNFVLQNAGQLRAHYRVGKMLGSGVFGEVRTAIHKESGLQRAVKVLNKQNMDDSQKQVFLNEVNSLKNLDHPNILKMYEFFEDDKRYYIVTDTYKGGEVFEEILARDRFTENDAAMLIRQLLSCVNYCHSNGIVHRDLRPENIRLESGKGLDEIQIVEFGTSMAFDEDEKHDDKIAAPYYVAPEMFVNNYDEKCDIWSIGVIAYVAISGIPPFHGSSDQEIMKNVQIGKFQFEDPIWNNKSDECKNFITQMLTKSAKKRPSAELALQHPWLERCDKEMNLKVADGEGLQVLSNLHNFTSKSKLQQATYAFIAAQLLSKQEKTKIDEIFRAMDLNGDGKLSKDEIQKGYSQHFGQCLSDQEVDQMFAQVDSDNSGAIDYSEFVVATMNMKSLNSSSKLHSAFKMFDKDGGGSISTEELKTVLSFGQNLDDELINKIINQVDVNGDGEISYQEFEELMMSHMQ